MSITKEYPIMDKKPMQKESVKSPSSATDPANFGGMPPTMTVDAIFKENTPPPVHAESSVIGIAPKASQGT